MACADMLRTCAQFGDMARHTTRLLFLDRGPVLAADYSSGAREEPLATMGTHSLSAVRRLCKHCTLGIFRFLGEDTLSELSGRSNQWYHDPDRPDPSGCNYVGTRL